MKPLTLADRAIEVCELTSTGKGQRRRIAAGLSLETAGRSIGVSAASVFRWERQERKPQGRNLVAYHKFLTRLGAFDGADDGAEASQ